MRHKKLFFITGSSGSGANLIARVLSRIEGVLGVGETHVNFDHFLIERFNEAQKLAWDRHADFTDHDRHSDRAKALLAQTAELSQLQQSNHIVFKRSMMDGDGYRADICDMRAMYPGIKIIVVYRNPLGATHSAYRRQLGDNLRHCAILQEEQLTVINGQLNQIPKEDRMIVSYDDFCEKPQDWVVRLAAFCELEPALVLDATQNERINEDRKDAWKKELPPEDLARLMEFFSYRTAQWVTLLSHARG